LAELSLRELQAHFFALITAPEGVGPGLRGLGMSAAELERFVASDERKTAVERLDIYANMYFFRIRDALAELMPKLPAAMGELAFHNLVTDYLLEHPSTHPSLRNIGRQLPDFLDRERRRSFGGTAERPGWLADLARLEWARLDVFDAADAATLTMERLRTLPPDDFAGLPLALVPACRRVPVRFAVDELWQALGDESELPAPARSPRTLLVWRAGGDVLHRALDPTEAEALVLVQAPQRLQAALDKVEGVSFGHVCDWLVERSPNENDENRAAQAAFQLLAQWATDGILVDRLESSST
jgi:hypothetical protein